MPCKHLGKAEGLERAKDQWPGGCSEVAAPAVPWWPVSSSKRRGELPMPRAPVDSISVGSITYRCPLSVRPCMRQQQDIRFCSMQASADSPTPAEGIARCRASGTFNTHRLLMKMGMWTVGLT